MGKPKRKHIKPKSRQEAQNYRYAVNHTSFSPEGTDQPLNDSLRGSDEFYSFQQEDEKNVASVPTPKRIQLGHWIKENTWEILIGIILVGILTWLCTSTIELKVKTAENAIRLEQIKEKLDGIDSETVSKELLKLELEAIEKDIDNINVFKIDSLDSRIGTLEKQIEMLIDNS